MTDKRQQATRRIDAPQPGFFKTRLVKGGPAVPAKICHENGEWFAVVDGKTLSSAPDPLNADQVMSLWTFADFITPEEYEYMNARRDYFIKNGIRNPITEPRKRIDLNELPPLF